MFGQSIRKCAYPSPARRGTSQVSTVSRLTSPSARNGTARTPLQFYLLAASPFSRRPTASTTRRSQRTRLVGSRLIQTMLALLSYAATRPKRFILRLHLRFLPLPQKG